MGNVNCRYSDVPRKRRGADIRLGAKVQAIEVHLSAETIEAETIVLAAGCYPVVASLPVEKDHTPSS